MDGGLKHSWYFRKFHYEFNTSLQKRRRTQISHLSKYFFCGGERQKPKAQIKANGAGFGFCRDGGAYNFPI